jgi:hypothetical protein
LKKYPVNKTDKKLIIAGRTLNPGLYYYALVINGKDVDVKRLILTEL